ncbi:MULTISPECIES: hypothetical protein [Flavobacterium]|uniref:Lipoprotein n=1 Tax=Flavobacterium keumense TaxID=1306518 RepID=A0ABY8N7A6_9FLAO|nr:MULTISPECIES: hypothetical protein [Flavobacterium]WGK95525.1 hypothetical protein MG292_04660 [Flavobacterium keumense]
MKNFIFLFIACQLLFSCKTVSFQLTPINDYVSSLNLKDSDTIMVIEEKINNNVTIDIFKGQIYFEPFTSKYERYEGVEKPLFNEKYWEKMKCKYENKYIEDRWVKGDYWTINDFNHKNIVFIKQEKFPDPGKYEVFDFKENYKVFSFSKPIYYKHHKYVAFSVTSTTTDNKYIDDIFIVVMVKINGKWSVLEKVSDGVYR